MSVNAATRAGQRSRARSVQCPAAARRHEIRPIEFATHARRQALAKWAGTRRLRTAACYQTLPTAAIRHSTFLSGSRIFAAPMKSMTGYGRGECAQDGFKVTVELSSVNRKQSEISVYLPRELEALESRIRDEINRRVARGRFTVKVSMHAANGSYSGRVKLNAALARAYARELNRLAKELKLAGAVTLETLVRAPGVLQTDEELSDTETFWPSVGKALKKALDALMKMREREGTHLSKDLGKRIATARRSVERVQKQAPEVVKRYQEQLRERIKNAGLEMPGVGTSACSRRLSISRTARTF